MADRVGQQLGNYHLIRLLGRGGFAEVYLGQHLRLNMQAAIKVLSTQLADEDVEHFQREAQTIAALLHRHIVRVLDFDVQGGIPFLVMDYAPNGTLRSRYPRGTRLPLATITSYVKQIAAALQYAHDERLIHRDVKPENMLLGRDHEVLLSDFGIALITQSSRYQVTQEATGTISYMAPEQIQGKPRLASDQYALGVVIYEWKGDCGGIMFRADNAGHYYLFEICPNGDYGIYLYFGPGGNDYKTLKTGSSSAIRTGLNQNNLVAAAAINQDIELYVNRQLVYRLRDQSYSLGQVGFAADGSGAIGGSAASTEVVCKNLKVWTF